MRINRVSDESGDMQKLQLEVTRLNLWTVGGIIIVGFCTVGANAYFLGSKISNANRDIMDLQKGVQDVRQMYEMERTARVERGKVTDANFKVVFDKMPQFDLLAQQILRLTELTAENSKAIEETNRRMELNVERTQTKLDTIISRQAEQSSDIKVIQSQLTGQQQQRTQRTLFPVEPSPFLRIR
ncbi:hypothetical protein P106B_10 [Rhizobium phage vB_RglS_P106B]|uniref:Uncharacterized protein n=1 Tax=Rhizobium phage vB_RglS_P106B TaxID=1458697 RepID=W6E9M7_9CAUD|nr:hypothetical protein P106B_10 [Rhizobium phage vB_RglS_P106B]AHJ10693.1 hypothetical protein P106B_10 [Rhizobium phage vB_RglS_P106B]